MCPFNRLSLRTKLFIGPAATTVVIVSLAWAFHAMFGRQQAALDNLYRQQFRKTIELSELYSKMTVNHLDLFDALAAADKGEIGTEALYEVGQARLDAFENIDKRLPELGRDYELTPREAGLLRSLETSFKAYRGKAISAIRQASVSFGVAHDYLIQANAIYHRTGDQFDALLTASHEEANGLVRQALESGDVYRAETELAVGLMAVLFLALGFFFSLELSRPLLQIARRMENIAGKRDSGEKLPVISDDEIGMLARNFNLMVDQLSETTVSRDRFEESESRYKAITDSTGDAIVSMDGNGLITLWNRSAARIFGYEEGEILGRELTLLLPPRFREAHRRGVKRFLETRESRVIGRTVELSGLRKDGEEFPLELTLSTWSRGTEVFFTGLVRDITQKKKTEEEKRALETQLHQASKLEAVGQLAAGIAHEINTPIQYVGDNVRFVQAFCDKIGPSLEKLTLLVRSEKPPNPDEWMDLRRSFDPGKVEELMRELSPAVEESLQGLGHVTQIVRAMNEFAHPGRHDLMPTDLNGAIEKVLLVSRNAWKYVADVETELDPALPPVACYPNELNQVFLNLVVNAAYAIAEKLGECEKGKGLITVRTRLKGERVEIEVADNGTGIPEKAREHVFEPFFTTKDVGHGTGQGLAIAYNIVTRMHKGTISFVTETGRGTTFTIDLPVAEPILKPIPLSRTIPS